MKMIEHNLHDNVFRTRLNIVIVADTDEWGKWLDKAGFTGERHEHKTKEAMYYRVLPEDNTLGNNWSVIFLRKQDMSHLVHELVHFIFNTFDSAGVPTRIENDEIFAYYMEYWVNSVREEWSELRQSKRKAVNSKKTSLKA